MSLGGGFLGVGSMEVAVILVVGWVVLGPKELIKLTREVGKIFGSLRGIATNARNSLQSIVEADSLTEEFNKVVQSVTDPLTPDENREEMRSKAKGAEKTLSSSNTEDLTKSGAQKKSATSAEATLPSTTSAKPLAEEKNNKNTEEKLAKENNPDEEKLAEDEKLAEENLAARSRFEEQMRRMNDPNQVAPSEVRSDELLSTNGDNDSEGDLELRGDLELEELERRYAIRRKQILESTSAPPVTASKSAPTDNSSPSSSGAATAAEAEVHQVQAFSDAANRSKDTAFDSASTTATTSATKNPASSSTESPS